MMKRFFFIFYPLFTLLSSCSIHQTAPSAIQPLPSPALKLTPENTEQKTLSKILSAEFAIVRSQPTLALDDYVQQAKLTEDPAIIERAYKLAQALNSEQHLLPMATLWIKAAPKNSSAIKAIALELAKNDQQKQACVYMAKLLTKPTDNLDFLSLFKIQHPLSKEASQHVIQTLALLETKYPHYPQTNYTMAYLLVQNRQLRAAINQLQAIKFTEQTPQTIILQSSSLQHLGETETALTLLKRSLTLFPNNIPIRLSYAQLLIKTQQYQKAEGELIALTKKFPNDNTPIYTLIPLYIESKQWDKAISTINQLLSKGIKSDIIYYNLGYAYEQKKQWSEAIAAYRNIEAGNLFLSAIARSTEILITQQNIQAAQQALTNARKQYPQYNTVLYSFEIEILMDNHQKDQAWALINKAITENNDNYDLLYIRSLLAEKRQQITLAEQDLQTIIAKDPNNAMALNALGYILSNHTTRYQEAFDLISKAHKLEPNDPAILDSLGWIHYRLGHLSQAYDYVQKAYQQSPNAEGATHLIEILWVQNKKAEANDIFEKAIKQYPKDIDILKDTMSHLTNSTGGK